MIYYRLCLDLAIELHEAGYKASEKDVEELLNEAKEIDRKFLVSILHLPLRLTMDYEKINKFRKKRTSLLVGFYLKLLKAGADGATYKEMVRRVFKKKDFVELNDNLLNIYTEESFIINSSLKSLIPMDVKALAHRLFMHMRSVGKKLNREVADEIYDNKVMS